MSRNREAEAARRIIDDSYREFVTDSCAWPPCGRTFRPTSPTKHYCSGACALAALYARDAAKERASLIEEEETR